MIWTIAKKELRGYFNSAIAVIFLTAFLAIAFYTFFWREKFFARGVADLRPLFEWMPRLLVILVSALAMRLWADERRAGTLEVLLTLPVPRWKLVLGKFTAGLLLIALALGLTLGLPITISGMGHMDWGPVVGGYLAALLLSAAYLAIGMCVSAATDNQIVAFVGTAFGCGIAYAIGDSEGAGAVGRFIGTGVRFESVARGVLDLRDLAYYGGIVAVGIAVNVLLLQRLTWGTGARTRPRRLGTVLAVVLVAANALALDAWLAPVHRARIDLTQDGTYSLSAATRKVLAGLDERVLIRGYFSDKMHPKLAPLVPQIRDLLEEYRIAGGAKVRVELVDPTDDEAAKREAKERFGVEPRPLRFASATEQSVINAYFAIAIEYGDQHAVLGIDDLISIHSVDAGNVEITTKNLEYQLTKTIRKTAAEFASIDALFAAMPGKAQLTAYVTPQGLPENWKDAPAKLKAVTDALVKQSGGKLEFKLVQPQPGGDEARELMTKYGVKPYLDPMTDLPYYFHLVLQLGERIVRVVPPDNLGEEQLKAALTEGLRRAAPGFTKVIGLWVPPPAPSEPMPEGVPERPMPPPQQFHALEAALAGDYEVLGVNLLEAVPDQVQTLVLAGPANLGSIELEHLDQFVMRGGGLIALAGRRRLAPADGIAVERVETGLEPLFAAWGIHVGDELVMDRKSESFPIPGAEHEIHQLAYPFFVKIDGDEVDRDSPVTSGLAGAVMHWSVPVGADPKVGDDAHHVDALLRSSPRAWLTASNEVEPDLAKFPKTGFADDSTIAPDKKGAQTLAVAISGGFASGTPAPAAGAPKGKTQLLAHSPPDTRIVVFGSSAFVSDDIVQLSQQLESELAISNIEMVHDAVDWSLGDTDLLVIRGHNAQAHALTLRAESRSTWRTLNVLFAALGLIAVVVIAWLRRRGVTAIVSAKAVA